ncbi:hypothetical protein [Dehalogenimonas etheniformans]|uniref:Uncharacterized protein n=1 Tax=Dehalogenimonas etheniformans TaxID=1536648 RepID=A0A2P5P9A5_9CHLR|nr:hypothetical protein [Dehalogenimonas etheniformans]PPD58876.1 hypothetical protein JP09_003150 [Dehalogenimonas etheniformans]QNT76356.1 hypothetical protein HX448_06475 [Dehalogenimonas etheniformans]
MEESESTNLPEGIDPTRFRSIKVFIYTTTGVFSGYTYCQYQQRLLDALNKGFMTSKLQSGSDFLPLFDLDVYSPGIPARHMDTVYVRKNNVLMVGESDSPVSGTSANAYPIRRKKTLQTVINLPQVSVKGNMYAEMWEELQDSLNRSDQFIPVTNVEIAPELPSGISRSSFVAVNKDHIVYVGK